MKPAAFIFTSLTACLLAAGLSGCGLIGSAIKTAAPFAGAKMAFACMPEHTTVDTPTGPRAVERLEPGDLVIGYGGKPVRVQQKHSYLENAATEFLHITFKGGASVDVCAMHRVAGIRAGKLRVGQVIADREVTRIESRRGISRSFDLLTGDEGYQMHGIPVNSMIEEMAAASVNGLDTIRE